MELKKEIESLLFSSGKVMTEQELAELTNNPEIQVQEALGELKKDYDERDTSLMLVQSGNNWKLNVREKYVNLVTKIVADTELPFPVLETLAIIAYKAPLIQAEVIKARGTNAYEHIGILVNEEFVDKRKEGRSFKISLTPKFFKYFDVEGEQELKEALKDAKIPEKPVPEKVGDMNVVEIPPEEAKEGEPQVPKDKLGDLEVIDEPEQEPKEEEEKVNVENNKPDGGFLNDIDKRINELSQRNNENEQDELFTRQGERAEEGTTEEEEPSEDKEGKLTWDDKEEKEIDTEKEPKEEEKLTWKDKEEEKESEETEKATEEEKDSESEEKKEPEVEKEIDDIQKELEEEKEEIAEKDGEEAEEKETEEEKKEEKTI